MELGLRGKVALVTGGSITLGKGLVEALAGQGVRVATCARGFDQLKEAAEEISSKTETEVLPVKADVTNSDDIKRFVTAAYEKFGRVDILVNSATNMAVADLWELTDADWLNHFNTKAVGYVRCAHEVLPYMRQQKWGRIINIVGGAARSGGGGSSGPVNAALINFSKVLSDEVAKDGITVNAIHPATVPGLRRSGDPERVQAYISTQRPESAGRPVDTGNMILFLCSDKAAAITGQTIKVSGSTERGVFY